VFNGGSVTIATNDLINIVDFPNGSDFVASDSEGYNYAIAPLRNGEQITDTVTETATDGSAPGAYANILTETNTYASGAGTSMFNIDISEAFFRAHIGTSITFEVDLNATVYDGDLEQRVPDGQLKYFVSLDLVPFEPTFIQNDYLAITRTPLPLDQATAVAEEIDAGTTTEATYVAGLLNQVANTTILAVAVEGSMYAQVGTSDEITKLATQFLPAQVQHATQNGLNATVYACEALGLAFAFGDENGFTGFGINYGPSNPATPNTTAGDKTFAAEAALFVFGSAETANTPIAIADWVSNWKTFYTSNGVPGVPNATADQIDLAARGAAWGDAVGAALASDVGPLPGQVVNFLEDAAQNTAVYSASLANQPTPMPLQGQQGGAEPLSTVVGVAALSEHISI
jgi:hypothetical protein